MHVELLKWDIRFAKIGKSRMLLRLIVSAIIGYVRTSILTIDCSTFIDSVTKNHAIYFKHSKQVAFSVFSTHPLRSVPIDPKTNKIRTNFERISNEILFHRILFITSNANNFPKLVTICSESFTKQRWNSRHRRYNRDFRSPDIPLCKSQFNCILSGQPK